MDKATPTTSWPLFVVVAMHPYERKRIVCAYSNEQRANEHCRKANEYLKAFVNLYVADVTIVPSTQYDKQIDIGTEGYSVVVTELRSFVP